MTYKEAITAVCTRYANNPMARFIGYNTALGSRMYGTLNNVPQCRCLETPVSENLMMGLAMGMSLEGYLPVVCFERHDFLLLALDALVNHVDKLPSMGCKPFPIIVRAIVGGSHPLDAGPQHTQNYRRELVNMLKYTPVEAPRTYEDIQDAYDSVGDTPSGAVVIVEYKDEYDLKISG